MYVERLQVHGFYSLEDVDVEFKPGLNVLIGKNNAGKSNIVRALDYVLGEKWPTFRDIEDRTFYAKNGTDKAESFSILVWLGGSHVCESALLGIGKKVRRILMGEPPPETIPEFVEWAAYYAEKSPSGSWPTNLDLVRQLAKADRCCIYLHIPRKAKRTDRMFGIVYHEGGTWYHATGFVGELRDALLTTAYVPAFRDPSSQLRINQYSWYGKLIESIYKEQRTEQQQKEIEEAWKVLNQTVGKVFQDATDTLKERLTDALFNYGVSFRPAAVTRDDEHKSITPFINDGVDAPYYDKGSGIQSALVIALFTLYCDTFHRASSLLLVEEPELYLHPQARRAVEAELSRFAEPHEDGRSERQVIVSTHAPEFLRSASLDALTLVYKPQGQIASQVRQGTSVDNKKVRQLFQNNAEIFFADHVILVEGGDRYVLEALANQYLGQAWLDRRNTSVARVDGKTGFRDYVRVLNDFGIGWTILTDLDFLRDGGKLLLSDLDPTLLKRLEELPSDEAPDRAVEVARLIIDLQDHSVFVLQNGELEDYYTDAGQAAIQDVFGKGKGKKDQKAIFMAEKIADCKSMEEVSLWLNTTEFCDLLDHVSERVQPESAALTPTAKAVLAAPENGAVPPAPPRPTKAPVQQPASAPPTAPNGRDTFDLPF